MAMPSNQEALLTREKEGGVGSVCASAVTLAKICVGCGVMALPWGFMRGGVFSLPGSAHLWTHCLLHIACARRMHGACTVYTRRMHTICTP